LMTCLFFGSAVSISFIDIVMEEWQDWKLSHRNTSSTLLIFRFLFDKLNSINHYSIN
jgi:hypothetical protein